MSSKLPLTLGLSCVYCLLRMSFFWLADWLFPWCDHPSHCFDFGAELEASVDKRVDPCDNFYDHVCGFWNGSHGYTMNQFHLLSERTKLLLFEELEKSPGSSPFTAGARVRAGYQGCLAVVAQQQEHGDVLRQVFAEFHLDWPSLAPPRKEFHFLRFLVGLSLRYDMHVLIKLYLEAYLLTDEGYSLAVSNSDSWAWQDSTPNCLRAVVGGANVNAAVLAERIARVRADLRALDLIARSQYLYSPRYYQFQELPALTRGHINVSTWLDVLNGFLTPDRQVSPTDLILTFSKSPLFLLWSVMVHYEKSMTDLLLHLGWKAFMGEAHAFSATLASCSDRVAYLDDAVRSGSVCVFTMLSLAPYAMVHVLLAAIGRADAVKRSKALTEHIRNASARSFKGLSWMDQNTSAANVHRILSVEVADGVPTHLVSLAATDRHYDYLSSFSAASEPFGRQLLQARRQRFEKLRRLMYNDTEQVRRRSEHLVRRMLSANAFYVPTYHVIIIPGTILQAPFAVDSAVPAVDFGSLGRIIGHELTHAFDLTTSSLDERVQPFTLYSASSRGELVDRLNCLTKQVNDGTGSQTLGNNSISETFADNAGVEKAYLAFKEVLQSEPQPAGAQPGSLGYTPQQLFFVSSCFAFCAFHGYAFDSNAIYPPAFLRCNTPVMNSPDFGVAFSCAQGAPMNPIIRCRFH